MGFSALLLVTVILAVLAPRSSYGQCKCPENCKCTDQWRKVECTNLQRFPKLCYGSQIVTIRDSRIITLKKTDELPLSVRQLTIERSRIKAVDAGFFPKGNDLTILSLRSNDLSKADWFRNIPKLENLDLSKNLISTLDLSATVQLTYLNLNGNGIHHSEVSSALCKMGRSHLHGLHLDGMRLTAFPQGIVSCKNKTIRPLPLSFLSLSNNQITNIPQQVTSMEVKTLYLASNKIRNIDLPQGLLQLVLANNPLSGKALAVIASRSSDLTHLDLSGVAYKNFPSNMFRRMTKLKNLSLMKCNISRLERNAFGMLESLTTLALQSNKLRDFPTQALATLKLEKLFLDHNNISHIKESREALELVNYLKKLGISHNPFYCDCSIYWFSTWIRNANKYRKTVIVNEEETVCTRPSETQGVQLSHLLLECHRAKLNCEIGVAIVSSVILLIIILGVLICCCRMGCSKSTSGTLLSGREGSKGYQAV